MSDLEKMKQKTKDSIKGFMAFVVIVVVFILMIEFGGFDFLIKNSYTEFRECQLIYGRTQCSSILDNN